MNVFCKDLQPGIGQGDNLMFVLPNFGARVPCAQKPDRDAQMHQDLGQHIRPLDMGGRMMLEPTHAIALAARTKAVGEVAGHFQIFIEPIQMFTQLFERGRDDRSPRAPKIVGGPEDAAALSGPRVVPHGLKPYILHEMFGPACKSASSMFRCGKTHQIPRRFGGWRDWVLSAWCVVKEHFLSHARCLLGACAGESLVWKPMSKQLRCFVANLQRVSS